MLGYKNSLYTLLRKLLRSSSLFPGIDQKVMTYFKKCHGIKLFIILINIQIYSTLTTFVLRDYNAASSVIVDFYLFYELGLLKCKYMHEPF